MLLFGPEQCKPTSASSATERFVTQLRHPPQAKLNAELYFLPNWGLDRDIEREKEAG